MNCYLKPFAVVFCFCLTGCVSNYQAKSDSTAEFTLYRSMAHLGNASNQEYTAFRDASCLTSQGSGRLAYLFRHTANEKSIEVDASAPIYLLANTTLYGTTKPKMGEYNITEDYCANFLSFTPGVGRQYDVKQEGSLTTCRLTVIDRATGAAPLDIRILDAMPCRQAWRSKSRADGQ